MGGNIVYTIAPLKFGNLYTHDSGVSVTCVSLGVDYPIPGLVWAVTSSRLGQVVHFDETLGTLTIGSGRIGMFDFCITGSFEASKVSDIHVALFKNSTKLLMVAAERRISVTNQIGDLSGLGQTLCSPGDVIRAFVKSDTNNTVVGFNHLSFKLMGPYQGA